MVRRATGKWKLRESHSTGRVEVQTQAAGHQISYVYVHLKSYGSAGLNGEGKRRAGERDISSCCGTQFAYGVVGATTDGRSALVENCQFGVSQIHSDALVRPRRNSCGRKKRGVSLKLLHFDFHGFR